MNNLYKDFKWEVAVITAIVVGSYLNAARILF